MSHDNNINSFAETNTLDNAANFRSFDLYQNQFDFSEIYDLYVPSFFFADQNSSYGIDGFAIQTLTSTGADSGNMVFRVGLSKTTQINLNGFSITTQGVLIRNTTVGGRNSNFGSLWTPSQVRSIYLFGYFVTNSDTSKIQHNNMFTKIQHRPIKRESSWCEIESVLHTWCDAWLSKSFCYIWKKWTICNN